MGEETDVKAQDLLVCGGCCCSFSSLYLKFPDCIGCKTEGICCCFQIEQAACKPLCTDAGAGNEEGKLCVCFEGGTYCVMPSTCIQEQQQFFCIDSRCAFPCHDKVPCVCTLCPFLVLFADWGFKPSCCQTLGVIIPRLKDVNIADVKPGDLK
mmetsp:Transcript_150783/g.420301  ORF Transcript_150783/g.420301 Transcript_150783/m.420301 type:complete len:153 (-) Transcript_150783:86-544(-)